MENILNFKPSSIDKLEKLKLLAVERKNFFIHDVIEHTILVKPFDLIFFRLFSHSQILHRSGARKSQIIWNIFRLNRLKI